MVFESLEDINDGEISLCSADDEEGEDAFGAGINFKQDGGGNEDGVESVGGFHGEGGLGRIGLIGSMGLMGHDHEGVITWKCKWGKWGVGDQLSRCSGGVRFLG